MPSSLTYSMDLSPLTRLYPVTHDLTDTFVGSPSYVGKLLLAMALVTLIVLLAIAVYRRRHLTDPERLALFDRRYAIYTSARQLCHTISSTGEAGPQLLRDFRQCTAQTRWLLNAEIHKYLQEQLYVVAVGQGDLASAHAGLPEGSLRDDNVWQQTQVRGWFHQQATKIDLHFAPFLQPINGRGPVRTPLIR